MKHRVRGKKLNQSTKHRRALLKGLVSNLIQNGQLKTTEAKSKAIKGLIDKLINKAKENTVHSSRILSSFLHDKSIVNRLATNIAPRFKKRTSGFTRTIRLGRRQGDNTMMVNLKFIDTESKQPAKTITKKAKKPKTKTHTVTKSSSTTAPSTAKTANLTKKTLTRTTHK